MTVINASFVKWVELLGGESTIHYTLAILFMFTIIYVVHKITT